MEDSEKMKLKQLPPLENTRKLPEEVEEDEDELLQEFGNDSDRWGFKTASWMVLESHETHGTDSSLLGNGHLAKLARNSPLHFKRYSKNSKFTSSIQSFFQDTTLGALKKAEARQKLREHWLMQKAALGTKHSEMMDRVETKRLKTLELREKRQRKRMERKQILHNEKAIVIQRCVRGFVARRKVQRIIGERNDAASKLQRNYARYVDCREAKQELVIRKRRNSAVIIQRNLRVKLAKGEVDKRRKSLQDAERLKQEEHERACAVQIQRISRGVLGRRRSTELRAQRDVEEAEAAALALKKKEEQDQQRLGAFFSSNSKKGRKTKKKKSKKKKSKTQK